jgi:hypothetical protein
MNASDILAERLTRRIDMYYRRFDETGDEKWIEAAVATDRAYLRLRNGGAA